MRISLVENKVTSIPKTAIVLWENKSEVELHIYAIVIEISILCLPLVDIDHIVTPGAQFCSVQLVPVAFLIQ